MQLLLALLVACSRPPEPAPPARTQPETATPVHEPASEGAELKIEGPRRLGASRGLVLDEYLWSYGADSGWAWVARLPRSARMTVEPSREVKGLSRFEPIEEGEVVVNGGFYEDGPMGLLVHGAKEHAPLTPVGGSGVLYWSEAGGTRVVHRDAWSGQGTEALQSIDRLVDGGKSVVRRRPDAPSAARTAIAVTSDAVLAVVLTTSDGGDLHALPTTRKGAEEFSGIPLADFADLLVWLGAEEAINMDGGISVEMRARVEGREYTLSGGPGTINAVRFSAEP